MAFPFFNELSFWLFATSGVILLSSFWSADITDFYHHHILHDYSLAPDMGGAPAGGWTSYAPLSAVAAYNHTLYGQSAWAIAIFVNGLASIAGCVQLHHDHRQHALPGYDDVPAADDRVVAFYHGDLVAPGGAGARRGGCHALARPEHGDTTFFTPFVPGMPGKATGGDPLLVPAPVLVLRAPGGVHHDPAGDGYGVGYPADVSPASRCSATAR